jgi:alpha-tubulin suppressor-like RCC1 family protein
VPIQAVVCGRAHTLLLRDEGVWSWGQSSRGVLGRGEGCDGSVIAKVEGVKGSLVGGAAGWAHSAVVTAAGLLYSCGSSVDGKLGY